MAAVLSNGKGFYHPLVYVLECHRLGISFLPPSINHPGPMFTVEGQSIRVPLTRVKGLTERTKTRMVEERGHGEFSSVADFYRRVLPQLEEMEAIIRIGGLDGFGKTRPALLWEAQHLYQAFGDANEPGQGWLLPPPSSDRIPIVALHEPTRRQRLEW
ncbi:MAG: polymerase alpha subunit [Verrucomicrobiales bacterium]|nr:polymerase alpha subunit [Verrucomicrobiales bacterium]